MSQAHQSSNSYFITLCMTSSPHADLVCYNANPWAFRSVPYTMNKNNLYFDCCLKRTEEYKNMENEFAKPSAEAVSDPGPPGLKLDVSYFHDFPLAEFHCKVFYFIFTGENSSCIFTSVFSICML